VRTAVIAKLKTLGAHSVFHYIPLHSASAKHNYARAHDELPVTDDAADRLLRLPLWASMQDRQNELTYPALSSI
jgi:dTDP-4-amino-4,6-dideoxygalactose transaminase